VRQPPTDSRPPLRFLIFSHHSYSKISHTIQLSIGTRKVWLCARCTGILIGMTTGLFYADYLAKGFVQMPILIAIFLLPAMIDWLLQVFSVRDSTNPRRIITGALIGDVYLAGIIALANGWFALLFFYALAFAAIGAVLYVLFRMTGIMDEYLPQS